MKKVIEKIKTGGLRGFNLWRENYDKLSFNEHKEIAANWAMIYPVQRKANIKFFKKRFKQLKDIGIVLRDKEVAELGSDDGWLAYNCMSNFKFKSWKGYDISGPRVKRTLEKARKQGFLNIELHKQFWETDRDEFDIFVSSHTIEHISNEHCLKLFDFVCSKADILVLEIQVTGNRNRWNNYGGSHILSLNRGDLEGIIGDRGFKRIGLMGNPFCGLYIKNKLL